MKKKDKGEEKDLETFTVRIKLKTTNSNLLHEFGEIERGNLHMFKYISERQFTWR